MEFANAPYDYVKQSMESGTATLSFCSNILSEGAGNISEFDLKWTANSMYAASADTSIVTIMHFILAMLLNPDILEKAQDEIDRVVGRDRLPTFLDKDDLPYVSAIVTETFRWAVPAPMGLPHVLKEEDVYEGMRIPKGSMVFANVWTMLRNEEIYPQADKFIPERFLENASPEMNPENYVFGFGRRICPGMYLIDRSIWLLLACMISTLSITKAKNKDGTVIEPVVDYQNAVFRTPTPFPCKIVPRDLKAAELLETLSPS